MAAAGNSNQNEGNDTSKRSSSIISGTSTGLSSEAITSLIAVGTLAGVLLIAIAAVIIYYNQQDKRISHQAERGPVGFTTSINKEKLRSHMMSKARGQDSMKQPVNWSNFQQPQSNDNSGENAKPWGSQQLQASHENGSDFLSRQLGCVMINARSRRRSNSWCGSSK